MTTVDVPTDDELTKRSDHKVRLAKQNEVDEDSSVPACQGVVVLSDDDAGQTVGAVQPVASDEPSVAEDCSKSVQSGEPPPMGGKFTDSSGVDLEEFITATLHKNAKDRQLLLDIERDLIAFVKDVSRVNYRFPPMSSYNRMILHRVAAFFGLQHNVDTLGTSVVVSRTDYARLPDKRFQEYIRPDEPFSADSKLPIVLKRESVHASRFQQKAPSPQKTRSFEEREEQYVKIRARIFNQSSAEAILESSMAAYSNAWSTGDCGIAGPDLAPTRPGYGMHRAVTVGSASPFGSSYDSDRLMLRRDAESVESLAPLLPPPPPLTPSLPRGRISDSASFTLPVGGLPFRPNQPVVFAVGSIEQVPVGAMILHPETGQPYRNVDGSIYRHNPMVWQMLASAKNGGGGGSGATVNSLPGPFRPIGGAAMQNPSAGGAAGPPPLFHPHMQQISLSVEAGGSAAAPVDGMAAAIQSPSNIYMATSAAMCTYFVSPQQATATGQPPPMVSNQIPGQPLGGGPPELQAPAGQAVLNRCASPQSSCQANSQLVYPMGCNVYWNVATQPMSNTVAAPPQPVYADAEQRMASDLRYPLENPAYLVFNGIRQVENHREADGVSSGHV